MGDLVIKKGWSLLFFFVFIVVSVGLNILSVSIFQLRVQFISAPPPGREVSDAFKEASPAIVAPATFSIKWGDRYYFLVETTKEEKEKIEKLQRNR